jgi:hypothetical protein
MWSPYPIAEHISAEWIPGPERAVKMESIVQAKKCRSSLSEVPSQLSLNKLPYLYRFSVFNVD